MSRDIETRLAYTLKCNDCDFTATCMTAAEAEHCAMDHLNQEGDDGGYKNYNHAVGIVQGTFMGRNV